MDSHDKSQGSVKTEPEKPAKGRAGQDPVPTQPGAVAPDAPLDDQPQREDEYLSNMLNEFNPQRKDEGAPLPSSEPGKKAKPVKPNDDTGKGKP